MMDHGVCCADHLPLTTGLVLTTLTTGQRKLRHYSLTSSSITKRPSRQASALHDDLVLYLWFAYRLRVRDRFERMKGVRVHEHCFSSQAQEDSPRGVQEP